MLGCSHQYLVADALRPLQPVRCQTSATSEVSDLCKRAGDIIDIYRSHWGVRATISTMRSRRYPKARTRINGLGTLSLDDQEIWGEGSFTLHACHPSSLNIPVIQNSPGPQPSHFGVNIEPRLVAARAGGHMSLLGEFRSRVDDRLLGDLKCGGRSG